MFVVCGVGNIKSIKEFLFIGLLALPVFASAEKIPIRDGDGPIIGYVNKDLVRPLEWNADTQLLVTDNIYRDGTVGIGQFDLNEHSNRFGCKLIKKSEDMEFLSVYLERPDQSKENDWSVFVYYPDNYRCNPSPQEVENVLDEKIKDEKKMEAYANSDESKENRRQFELEQKNKSAPGQCDGKQMFNYVDFALDAGRGVLNVASNEAYGGAAVSLALRSSTMGHYNSAISDIREHDLYLARSGCKSLKGGPTKDMLSDLKKMDVKIGKLVNSQYNQKGVITNGFGELK